MNKPAEDRERQLHQRIERTSAGTVNAVLVGPGYGRHELGAGTVVDGTRATWSEIRSVPIHERPATLFLLVNTGMKLYKDAPLIFTKVTR